MSSLVLDSNDEVVSFYCFMYILGVIWLGLYKVYGKNPRDTR